MTAEVRHQQIVPRSISEELLHGLAHHMGGFVEQGADLEAADLRIPQHPCERFGVPAWGAELAQSRCLVLGTGKDQSVTSHRTSPAV